MVLGIRSEWFGVLAVKEFDRVRGPAVCRRGPVPLDGYFFEGEGGVLRLGNLRAPTCAFRVLDWESARECWCHSAAALSKLGISSIPRVFIPALKICDPWIRRCMNQEFQQQDELIIPNSLQAPTCAGRSATSGCSRPPPATRCTPSCCRSTSHPPSHALESLKENRTPPSTAAQHK